MIEKYTENQWEEEKRVGRSCGLHNQPFGTCNLQCPSCKEFGFYGSRELPYPPAPDGKITRKYTACKWCGFWQEARGDVFDQRGGDPYQCVVVMHKKCGAENVWNALDGNKWCEDCKDNMDIIIPKDDPTHQDFKKQMDRMHQNLPRTFFIERRN